MPTPLHHVSTTDSPVTTTAIANALGPAMEGPLRLKPYDFPIPHPPISVQAYNTITIHTLLSLYHYHLTFSPSASFIMMSLTTARKEVVCCLMRREVVG